MATLRFALISDVHLFASGQVPPNFPRVIAQVVAQRPRFVVLCGDMTSGNKDDGHDLGRVRAWWRQAHDSLRPLRDAGIALLPIAGNHDYYTAAQRQGFAEAAPLLAQGSPWADAVAAPRCYSISVDGLHLSLIHAVDQRVEPEVAGWLQAELAGDAARGAALRLCVGHVPLVSAMGHSSVDHRDRLGGLLCGGGVAAYFAGHEHLVWDQELTIAGRALRQVLVTTASATYQFPLRAELCAAHCRGAFGTLPASGLPFLLDPRTREQVHPLGFTLVDVDSGGGYEVTAMTLDDAGQARPFDERALLRWLQEGLARALGDDLRATGRYDDATEQAVRRFQQAQGLAADGIAGPVTQRRLRELLG